MAAEDALLVALKTSNHPALAGFEIPRYCRELRPCTFGTVTDLRLEKRGWRTYKRRYPFPATPPPPADTVGVQNALNKLLPPQFEVTSITDEGTYIKIKIRGGKQP